MRLFDLVISKNKSIVWLSPHLDDLAYSNGGLLQLISRKQPMLLINIFTNSNYFPYGNFTNSKIRFKEDEDYCKINKIDFLNFNYDDCSLRGYTDETEINSCVLEDDFYKNYKNVVTNKIAEIDFDIIFCPLSIGNHIDHQIVFEIVNQMDLEKQQVIYYEDLPYAAEFSLQQIDQFVNFKIGHSEFIEIDISNVFDEKLKSLSIYKSQVSKREVEMVIKHSSSIKRDKLIERIWIKK